LRGRKAKHSDDQYRHIPACRECAFSFYKKN
jgi:hypothetical protein